MVLLYHFLDTIEMMKRLWLEKLPAWILIAIFGLIVLHAPMTVYLGSHFPAASDYIKSWKELLVLVAAVPIVIDLYLHKGRGFDKWEKVMFWLVASYILLHLVALVWSPGNTQSLVAGLMIDLRYVAYFALVYVFVRLHPRYLAAFIKVSLAGAAVVLGFAVLQLLLPRDFLTHLGYGPNTIEPYLTVDKNPNYVRFSSTLRGPNPLGAYAVIVLAIMAAFADKTRRHWQTYLLATSGLVALWVSYSRSAWLAAIAAVSVVIAVRYGSRISHRAWLIAVAAALIVTAFTLSIGGTNFIDNVIYHNNPTTGGQIDSNAGHLTSLENGLTRLWQQPLGAGVGSTGSASLFGPSPMIVENQYLYVGHEVGWLGLGLFLAITLGVCWRLWQLRDNRLALGVLAGGIGMLLVGLLLPVWSDDTVSIIWWGLAAIAIVKGGDYESKTDQKTA